MRSVVKWLRIHPQAADAILAALLAAISLVGLSTIDGGTSSRAAEPTAYLLSLAMSATIAFRRRMPEAMLWTSVLCFVPFWVLDYVDSGASFAVLINLYTVANHVERRRSIWVASSAVVPVAAVMTFDALTSPDGPAPVVLVGNLVVLAVAWAMGDMMQIRRVYMAEVKARADRVERDSELAAERAAQQERARIARELHDIVSHSVSVMVVHTGAALSVIGQNREQAVTSLQIVESTGRSALDELRRVLGVLHAEPGVQLEAPQPTASDVDALVRRWRDAGQSVGLTVNGDPPKLGAGVSLTVYRIVQEALTNTFKHAGPNTRSDVCVSYGKGAVTIEVADDGRGPVVDLDGARPAGRGLIGMRERVELFGGTLLVGPRPGGGFRVRAVVPLGSPVSS